MLFYNPRNIVTIFLGQYLATYFYRVEPLIKDSLTTMISHCRKPLFETVYMKYNTTLQDT